jgi:hypothetical protein
MDKPLKIHQAEDSKPDVLFLWSLVPENNKKYYKQCLGVYITYKLRSQVSKLENVK